MAERMAARPSTEVSAASSVSLSHIAPFVPNEEEQQGRQEAQREYRERKTVPVAGLLL
jgi:hypothetical protein